MSIPRSADRIDNLLTLIFMALTAVMLVGILVTVRVLMNTHAIQANMHEARVQSCLGRVTDVSMFNALLTDMAHVEQAAIKSGDDPALTHTRRERIRVYRSEALTVPDCRKEG